MAAHPQHGARGAGWLPCVTTCQCFPNKLLFGVYNLRVKPRTEQGLGSWEHADMRQVSFQRGIITQPGVTCIYFTFSCISLAGLRLPARALPFPPAPVLGPAAGPGQQECGPAARRPAPGSLTGLDFLTAVPNSPGLTPISPVPAPWPLVPGLLQCFPPGDLAGGRAVLPVLPVPLHSPSSQHSVAGRCRRARPGPGCSGGGWCRGGLGVRRCRRAGCCGPSSPSTAALRFPVASLASGFLLLGLHSL